MPISGGITGGGGGGYLALSAINRIIGSNAGAGNASDVVIFIGQNAGGANAGTRNIGIGINASREAFTTDLIVIGNNNPTRLGEPGGNVGGVLIGNGIMAAFQPGPTRDADAMIVIGNESLANTNPLSGISRTIAIGYQALLGVTGDPPFNTPPFDGVYTSVAIGNECGTATGREGGLANTVLIGDSVASLPFQSDPDGFRGPLYFSNTVAVGAGACTRYGGDGNTAVGSLALSGDYFRAGTGRGGNGSNNTAVGLFSGTYLGAGDDNVIVGALGATGLENGHRNTVVGAGTKIGTTGNPLVVSSDNIVIGNLAGMTLQANKSIFLGRRAGNANGATVSNKFFLEHFDSPSYAGPMPFLYGELDKGNLLLGNRDSIIGPINRTFGANAVNNFKIHEGAAPTTPPDAGVSLYVLNVAGVYSLRCIGPGGVAQVLATGL